MKFSHLVISIAFLLISNGLFAQYVLDADFKGGGTHLYGNETKGFVARQIIVDDEAILVTGGERNSSGLNAISIPDSVLTVYKFDRNGNVASLFGNGGFLKIKFDTKVQVKKIQSKGSYYYIGLTDGDFISFTDHIKHIIKIDVNGVLDSNFGTNGIKTFAEPPRNFDVTQNLGLFTIKTIGIRSEEQIVLSKHLPNGSIDSSFGTNGSTLYSVPFSNADNLIINEATATIFIIGTTKNDIYQYTVLKVSFNGEVDDTYGNQGQAKTAMFETDFGIQDRIGEVHSDLIDEQIYIGGTDRSEEIYHICALDKNGEILSNFGDSGVFKNSFGRSEDFIFSPQKELLVISAKISEGHEITLLDSNANVKTNFGANGTLNVPISGFSQEVTFTTAPFEDGFIVAGISLMNEDSLALSLSKFVPSTTNIAKESRSLAHLVFPNPTQNVLHLPKELSTQNLSLFNVQGKEFAVPAVISNKVDVSQLQPGVYFLQATDKVVRFVKE